MSGRVVHLNLNYLVGVFRLDIVGRVGDQDFLPAEPNGSGAGMHGWQNITDPREAPDLALFLDGLEEPVICGEVEWEEIELAAATLQHDPNTGIVRFFDDEILRTRFHSRPQHHPDGLRRGLRDGPASPRHRDGLMSERLRPQSNLTDATAPAPSRPGFFVRDTKYAGRLRQPHCRSGLD